MDEIPPCDPLIIDASAALQAANTTATHQRRRFAIVLCASDAVITNVDFSRTK